MQFQLICNRLYFCRFHFYHRKVSYHQQCLKKARENCFRFQVSAFLRWFFGVKSPVLDGLLAKTKTNFQQFFLFYFVLKLTMLLPKSPGPIQISSVIVILFLFLLLNFPECETMKLFFLPMLLLPKFSIITVSYKNLTC